MNERTPYPSDLTDAQWALVDTAVTPPAREDRRGRPQEVDLREVVNGVLYVLREGCRWRALPHDLPAWQTVYWYFTRWTDDGTRVRLHDALRGQRREASGRAAEPTAVISDSQSVQATEKGGMWAMMRVSRSRGRSGLSPSIRVACCCALPS